MCPDLLPHSQPGLVCSPSHGAGSFAFSAGWGQGLITQNVDRLHHKAGSANVLELHGTTHQVVCMGCGQLTCRHELQRALSALNPDAAAAAQHLAALQDATDDRERLLRAGTAAPVHPSLRVKGSAGGVGVGRTEGEEAIGLMHTCPGIHTTSCAHFNKHLRLGPPACLPQESSNSSSSTASSSTSSSTRSSGSGSSSSGGASFVQRPDGDAQPAVRRPDGDMEMADGGRGFRVPPCSACGGVLKPHVVFFGDGERLCLCMCVALHLPAGGWWNGHVLLGQQAAPSHAVLPLPLLHCRHPAGAGTAGAGADAGLQEHAGCGQLAGGVVRFPAGQGCC